MRTKLVGSVILMLLLACGKSNNSKDDFIQRNHSASRTKVEFVDVTKEAGIQFKYHTGASGRLYFVEIMGSGGGFFDYNNDGYLDIYLVNGADLPGMKSEVPPTNKLYRNNGDGTFTDVTLEAGVGDTTYGMGCVAGDYDNDGDEDLYVTNFGANKLYRNNGDGTFTDVTLEAGVGDTLWSYAAIFFDYDNDGDLDLFSENYLDYSIAKDKKCYVLTFRDYCSPFEYDGQPNNLYRNNGDGTFTNVTKEAGLYTLKGKGMGAIAVDFDNDGDIDLYVTNDRVPGFLYLNNGDGTFTEVGIQAGVALSDNGAAMSGMGPDAADYDNDGDFDIYVPHYSYEVNSLYSNDGNGFFSFASYTAGIAKYTLFYVGFAGKFVDYDNDGYKDILTGNGSSLLHHHKKDDMVTFEETNQMFRNNGDGTFNEVSKELGPAFQEKYVTRGVAVADYDNDGDMDILVCDWNDTAKLWRNNGGNRNNWLMVKTVGTRSNRDGMGARVKVTAGGITQTDQVKCGGSYLSDSDHRLHFGLGKSKTVDLIEVRWPSGLVEQFRDIKANQLVVLTEGEGITKQVAFTWK